MSDLSKDFHFFTYLQEKDLKMFRERLKQELKLVKQEVDMLPKNQRKDTLKRRRDAIDIEHGDRVQSSGV